MKSRQFRQPSINLHEPDSNKHGLSWWHIVCLAYQLREKERPGFGTSVENVVYEINEFEKRKRMQKQQAQKLAQQQAQQRTQQRVQPPQEIDLADKFHNGVKKLEQKANLWIKNILNKISNKTND